MDIERVRTYAEFTKLEPVWNDLLTKAAANSIFLTHEWASSWWNTYAGKRELSILVLKDGEAVRAIAPLMITDYSIFRRLGFIGSNRPDYCDFIVHGEHLAGYEALITYLFYDFTDWDEIMLENIPETSHLFTALNRFSSHFIVRKRESDLCPYLELGTQQDDLLRNLRKKKSLKQNISKLTRAGNLTFRHYHNQDDMEESLGYLLRSYLERFDSVNLDKRLLSERSFYLELLRRMNPKGMIRFAVLELDGRPIAQHFGFSYNGVYYYVRPSFDRTYSEYSPGLVLLYYLIEYAAKNGYAEFDFLRGKETYKMRMADQSRRVMIVNLYRSFPKLLVCMASTKIKRLLQKSPFRQT